MLSGSIAAFLSWAVEHGREEGAEHAAGSFPLGLKPSVLAAWGACYIARNAAARAYEKKGRSMLAGERVFVCDTEVMRLLNLRPVAIAWGSHDLIFFSVVIRCCS